MIKLTPEYVGTRVLLSDSTVHFIIGVTDTHYLLTEAGKPFSLIKTDSLDDDITLLFDAPNPLDVPVPEWCEWIVGWFEDEGPTEIVPASSHRRWSKYPPNLRNKIKWSPAPGQMPPKNNEEIN
jgi:hypothetical protein